MDYEKKYKEALERARKLWNEAKANEYTSDIEDYETIFPELAESEDERVRNWLVISVNNMADCWFADDAITREIVLAWLEKQKENPKTAISIPADCASNAKCPYKTHGDGDFDEYIKDTPAYYFGFDDGVRSEREKQKEQKPAE